MLNGAPREQQICQFLQRRLVCDHIGRDRTPGLIYPAPEPEGSDIRLSPWQDTAYLLPPPLPILTHGQHPQIAPPFQDLQPPRCIPALSDPRRRPDDLLSGSLVYDAIHPYRPKSGFRRLLWAFRNASATLPAQASPQGLPCLTIATAGAAVRRYRPGSVEIV